MIRARHGDWAALFEVLRRPEFTAHLETIATGSAYPAVKPEGFHSARIPWFAGEDIAQFEGTAGRLRLRSASADLESRTLAALRDTLLPKLMSGEIDVMQAQKDYEPILS